METLAWIFADRRRYELAQRVGRLGQWPLARSGRIRRLPGALSGWTEGRDAPALPAQTFREWWRQRERDRNRDRNNERENNHEREETRQRTKNDNDSGDVGGKESW